MTELSDLLQHMARGGYRLHRQWGLMEPGAVLDTPEPVKTPQQPPVAPERPFDGTLTTPIPLGGKDES